MIDLKGPKVLKVKDVIYIHLSTNQFPIYK